MRAFTMNVRTYSANAQHPFGGAATAKQNALVAEMGAYTAGLAIGAQVNLAGFTEVLVPDNAQQNNVTTALDDFANALNIPVGGGRHFAVIRCGRTVLQDSNEVVAIVLDGNAFVVTYGLLWFDNPVGLAWQNGAIAAAGGGYTSHLAIPGLAVPDYRYIVYVQFVLAGAPYTVGFIHNRAPNQEQKLVVMQGIRHLLGQENPPVNLTMCGGDFNAPSYYIAAGPGPGQQFGHGHNARWYYSPGPTTVANSYDYWISLLQLPGPGGAPTASSDRTPNAPNVPITGSDHRGVGIDIV